ncbi:hypothetical protein [Vibrio nigripulchritudo]|uniref:Uncharacterized protein n=1 Tax=Vibrio nigripulchritudo TaxID=28173 RepID=A0A9P1JLC6_9VIBR|nr:hypothetical protein [Vibrio nigripulchritudo]CBJ93220.1 Protein of unknown function [Vibrio nigripulchritudo]
MGSESELDWEAYQVLNDGDEDERIGLMGKLEKYLIQVGKL